MAAFLIIDIKVLDIDVYTLYTNKVKDIIIKYGGEYILRTNNITQLSGNWDTDRIVIIKFPTMEKIKECFSSSEYIAIKHLREISTIGKSIIVEN